MNLITSPGDGVYANATFYIIGVTVVGGVIWLIMCGSIAGEAAARDVQTRMHPLTYTAPVTKFNYLGGRFLATFAVNALLVLSLPLGVLLAFYLPGLNEDGLGPFMPSAYISVYFFILLPNAFVATALQFSFATLSRQVMTSYLASFLLAISAQLIGMTTAKLFGNWDLVKLLDPAGLVGIMGNELETWTVAEKNTRLIALEGMFLWNRVLWVSVGIASLLITYFRFGFDHPVSNNWWSIFKRKQREQPKTAATNIVIGSTPISIPRVHRTFGFTTYFSQTLTIAWVSFKKIIRNPASIVFVLGIVLVSALFGHRIMTQFEIPLLPTTQQVLDYLTAPVGNVKTPWVVIPLLIIFFSGSLFWSEREAGLSDIADATPVPEAVLFIGKFLGLSLIIVVWMALLLLGGILMQSLLGYTNFETGLYVKALFGIQLINYLLFALLALVVHIIVNQKYIGHLVMLLVFIFLAFPSKFNVEHNLLIFGSDPGWSYTDMRGFGSTIGPWLWFKLYWISWALLLALTARLLWYRGREQSLKYRLQSARHRFTRSAAWVAIVASVLIVTFGGFIFYNTNVLNEYMTSSEVQEQKVEYELRYGRYRNTPQPHLTSTKLQVEIYPDQQQVEIHASYKVVNTNAVPIDSIHLGSVSAIAPSEVTFNRSATSVVMDHELCHQIYVMNQPLQPGDSLQINFIVKYKQDGFRHRGTNTLVVENGTYFTNYDLLPAIGYLRYRELSDPVVRKKYNLPARPLLPSLYDQEARKKPMTTDQNSFEAIVGTAENEVAVAPGMLQRTWTKGNRRYFHFKTDAPIRGEYAFLSANYAVHESKWNDVVIRIYHHPYHDLNIDRMLRRIKASLEYYSEQFGPYPFEHLTIVERAGADGSLSSEASMIDYGEQFSLMKPDDSPDGFDLTYYIVAHEVAHQWFGGARLTPAYVEGAGVLIEGLAVYSGMQVLEKSYGAGHLRQYVNFLHSFYEMPRVLATPSLLQANESFLYYRKGGLAMYGLSKYIGKEKVNDALRNMLQKHSSGELPFLTTLDMYQELQAVTPDSLDYVLRDLFENNTYWRLKAKEFSATETKTNNWEVTMKILAQKVVVDSEGNESDVPMNDWIEVGIYEEGKGLDESLYLQMHRIRSGEQTIKINVPQKPERGIIDPNNLTIDIRLDDNMMKAKKIKNIE